MPRNNPPPPPRPYYFLGGNRGLTTLATGQPFLVNTSDTSITPWLIMAGRWETFADNIVSSYVKPGMTIVDVGSNVGYYTVKWGGLIGNEGKIFAIEPNPDNAKFTLENIKLNGLSSTCEVFAVAAGAAEGVATLTTSDWDTGLGTLLPIDCHSPNTIEVPVRTLDSLLSDVKSVDLIKIDAEGYEPEILRGSKAILKRSPQCAFHIEVHSSWSRIAPISKILKPLVKGRCIFVIKPHGMISPIDLETVASYTGSQPGGIADIFMCPAHDDYIWKIASFMER